MTEAEAVHTAAVALGVTKVFNYRLMATCRTEVLDGIVEAVDVADFERILREDRLTHDERAIHDIEGDEIVYYNLDGDDDEEELDMRQPGEPFSWEACELVKALAKAPANLNKHLDEWIEKARKLCETPHEQRQDTQPDTTTAVS